MIIGDYEIIVLLVLLTSYGVNYGGNQEVSDSCSASSVNVDFLLVLDT